MASFTSKKTNLYLFLSAVFLTNAIVAEIIGVKIFSAETFLGIAPAQLHLLGDFVLDFNLTAGVVIWPFVFITSDIINEYYGVKGVKQISYITAGFIAYSFLIIYFVTTLPPAQFWLDVNKTDAVGNPVNINNAFAMIFRQGLGIIIGSITAFMVGQLLDATVFQSLKKITGSRKIWLRATGSTLVSQLIDSFVVLTIAFYIFGNWSFKQVIAVAIVNYIYKFFIAVALTPILYVAHFLIDNYLGKEHAKELANESSMSSFM
ncbi:queuosine precursor transporter [Larkinella terrae]|uniref:Probable queuosine precursor transporter n=1 Tax=Larkinella terrae TaxID=2025311 RepID=A0A7K0EU59_9BACT|nr:queuosine precursor transporter [Larkinella terrae]MRS65343.1 queuosine precursor transporter [Larkinella terrae]